MGAVASALAPGGPGAGLGLRRHGQIYRAEKRQHAWAVAGLPLRGSWRPAGWRRWLGHPSPAASPECRGSAPAPSGIPGAGEGSCGPPRSGGPRLFSRRRRRLGLLPPPTCGREARHTWGWRARDHIRSDAQESPSRPHPRLRPPVQPVLPVPPGATQLPPPPEPRAGGGGARGAGLSLKGPGRCPSHFLGAERAEAAAEAPGPRLSRFHPSPWTVVAWISRASSPPAEPRHLRYQLRGAPPPSPGTRAGAGPRPGL